MNPFPPERKSLHTWCNVLFALSILVEILYILHLPLFPSSDGPVHLYYAHILWSLASHQPQYQQLYSIRHLIGNYSINYYALILFEHFVSPARAEELFVAVILINTALGFRFLAGRLGANAAVASLWLVPLLLSGPLSGGFFNYCFAVGMLYWTIGFWISLPPRGRPSAFAGFVIALFLLALSHPAPLLVLVPFLAVDLGIVWLEEKRFKRQRNWRLYGPRLCAFLLSVLAIILPALHVKNNGSHTPLRYFHPHLFLLVDLLHGKFLGMFTGRHILEIVYQVGIIAIVPGVLVLAAKATWARLRSGETNAADRLLIFSVIFLGITLCLPFTFAGLFYFPLRMWSLLWPLILACGAVLTLRLSALRWLAIAAGLLILVSGVVTSSSLAPVARMQQEIAQLTVPANSKVTFLEPLYMPRGFQYYVFYWSGVRAIVQSHAVLLNSPWLDELYFPIAEAQPAVFVQDYFPGPTNSDPPQLSQNLTAISPGRDSVLQSSDYLLYADPENGDRRLKGLIDGVLQDQKDQWSCTYGSYFALCGKKQASAENTRSPLP